MHNEIHLVFLLDLFFHPLNFLFMFDVGLLDQLIGCVDPVIMNLESMVMIVSR